MKYRYKPPKVAAKESRERQESKLNILERRKKNQRLLWINFFLMLMVGVFIRYCL